MSPVGRWAIVWAATAVLVAGGCGQVRVSTASPMNRRSIARPLARAIDPSEHRPDQVPASLVDGLIRSTQAPAQRNVVSKGYVTRREYAFAIAATVACVRAAAPLASVSEPMQDRDSPFLTYTSRIGYARGEPHPDMTAIMATCTAAHSSSIDLLYRWQAEPPPAKRATDSDAAARCIAQRDADPGVIPKSLSAAFARALGDGHDEDAIACLNGHLELLDPSPTSPAG